MRVIRRISAVIIGFVFFLAGVFKLMDPIGSGLIVNEYLNFFHLQFLHFASLIIACSLALIESIIGAALITGVWRKITAIATLCFTSFFTIITLILLIFNPKMDCGCFGEVIHLTHSQTFIKNLILLALWSLAFLPFSKLEPTRKVKFVSFSISSISVCLFLFFSLFSMPLMDFTDFRPGEELENSKTYLSINDSNGDYFDELLYESNVYIISVYEPEIINEVQWNKIKQSLEMAKKMSYTPLLLISSNEMDVSNYSYFSDRKSLLTLNRSNGGATYISDGQIIGKWSLHRLPKEEKLSELLAQDKAAALIEMNNASNLKLQAFLLYAFAIMLLL